MIIGLLVLGLIIGGAGAVLIVDGVVSRKYNIVGVGVVCILAMVLGLLGLC